MGLGEVTPDLGRIIFIGEVTEISFINDLDEDGAHQIVVFFPRGRTELGINGGECMVDLG
jgi:hypothetical protein